MRYVIRNGECVEYDPDKDYEEKPSAPAVHSDYLPGHLKHHGTGKRTDSKSDFRKMTKASGCVEMGNDAPKPRAPIKLDRRERRDDIGRAIYNLTNGIKQ